MVHFVDAHREDAPFVCSSVEKRLDHRGVPYYRARFQTTPFSGTLELDTAAADRYRPGCAYSMTLAETRHAQIVTPLALLSSEAPEKCCGHASWETLPVADGAECVRVACRCGLEVEAFGAWTVGKSAAEIASAAVTRSVPSEAPDSRVTHVSAEVQIDGETVRRLP